MVVLMTTHDLQTLVEKYKMDVCRWTHPKEYDDQDYYNRRRAEANLNYWTKKLNERLNPSCTPF